MAILLRFILDSFTILKNNSISHNKMQEGRGAFGMNSEKTDYRSEKACAKQHFALQ